MVELAVGFVKGVFDILKRFTAAVDRYKAVAVRGVVGGLQKGGLQMHWGARRNTTLKQLEAVDDAP
ncbi:hypothetical protein, partial [Pseudomonas proteolytica]|uniref:hypothetical protein n=1 Tax=Pseudomonas proteolytica TaxID=219574 RepID=UPI0030D84D9B